MSEQSDLPAERGEARTVLLRSTPDGGLEPAQAGTADYREGLRSRRWNAAPLENPEVEKTDPRIAVAFIVGLAALTLLVIVIGYGVGLWELSA